MFNLNDTELDETLSIIYQLPKMYKTPISVRFIVDSNCSTKPFSNTISKIFKIIFNTA